MKKVLLIDGDQFLFKACVAVEKEILWDDQNHVLYSNVNEAWGVLTDMLTRIFERFKTEEHALTFSTAPNFRMDIDPTYKNNRVTRKPLCYVTLREKLEGSYNCVGMPGLEADDVMGILATKPGSKARRIIVSQDKDMRTIPATVWNGKDLTHVTEAEADRFHLYQALIGDTSDGYPGCPGVGPVAAEELLTEPYIWESYEHVMKSGPRKGEMEVRWKKGTAASAWDAVVSSYVKAGLTAEHALTQARLARILRWSDWNTETKSPILWTPKSNEELQ